MLKNLVSKLKESYFSIMPIVLIVVVLGLTIIDIQPSLFVKFIICAILLIFGMALFNLGAEMSMIPIGESIGSGLTKSKKIWLMLVSAFAIGFVITFAEPDLSILATQSPINKWIFIICVSVGVAVFLLLAVLKILFNIRLNILLTISYGLVFLLAILFPNRLVALSFDSGSVTTGPISVPFIMAFGLGLSAVRKKSSSDDDSFGLIALASAGPILSVMLLSLFIKGDPTVNSHAIATPTWSNMMPTLFSDLLASLSDIAIVLLPILAIFLIFQFTMIKLPKRNVGKILIGLLYTYLGISIFLAGIESSFLPIASEIGTQIIAKNKTWILIPLSLLIGYFIISAEPAVHVLKKQVEEITNGAIKQKTILITMSVGVALSVLIAMLKTLLNIPFFYIVLPIYAITLILSYFNSSVLSAVAFDAGGTATGAMAVSFVLPLISGVSSALGQDALTSAFGTVALIAIMPILTIQILGFIHKLAERKTIVNEFNTAKSKVKIIDFENNLD